MKNIFNLCSPNFHHYDLIQAKILYVHVQSVQCETKCKSLIYIIFGSVDVIFYYFRFSYKTTFLYFSCIVKKEYFFIQTMSLKSSDVQLCGLNLMAKHDPHKLGLIYLQLISMPVVDQSLHGPNHSWACTRRWITSSLWWIIRRD